jgi:hypothetical protein
MQFKPMNNLKKIIIILIFTFQSSITFAQNNTLADASIYTEFNAFFDNEIKRQGVKGNWIFMLNEITGIYKFDYNNDGFNDVLIEFNAIPVDEGSYMNYYSVLFINIENKKYSYVNYMESIDLKFKEFYNTYFVFQQQEQPFKTKKYKLVKGVFKSTKNLN